MATVRTVTATRYVTPLREGGSLPAIVEADDDGLYVLKFRGAGQGTKALIAELLSGEIGRALGLPVPEIVFVQLDPILANAEPDEEIQDLLKRSAGLNLALDFLPGSLAFSTATVPEIDPAFAADVVWFDSLVTNVDRTPRNPNIVVWHNKPWLIDHGASLIVQHTWTDWQARARSPFAQSAEHILLPVAGSIMDADQRLRPRLSVEIFDELVRQIPDDWLEPPAPFATVTDARAAYTEFLSRRLDASSVFVEEAERARTRGL